MHPSNRTPAQPDPFPDGNPRAQHRQPDHAQPERPGPEYPRAEHLRPEHLQPGYPQPGYPQPEHLQPGYPQPGYPQTNGPQTEHLPAGNPPASAPAPSGPRTGPPSRAGRFLRSLAVITIAIIAGTLVRLIPLAFDDSDDGHLSTPVTSSPTLTTQSTRPDTDAPTRFDTVHATALSAAVADDRVNDTGGLRRKLNAPLPLVLLGSTAYLAEPDRLTVLDTGTGKVQKTVTPKGTALSSSGRELSASHISAPLAAEVDGEQYVFASFPVRSSGRYQLGNDIELVGVHADTGKKAWSMLLVQKNSRSGIWTRLPTVVGVHGHILVLRVSTISGTDSFTMGIDTRSRTMIWGEHLHGEIVFGDTLVGRGRSTGVAAWSVRSGKRIWAAREDMPGASLAVAPGGAKSVVVVDGNDSLSVLSVADGRERFHLDGGASRLSLWCEDDARSAVVCSAGNPRGGGGWVGVFDRDTSELLWQMRSLSQYETHPPTVTASWHGVAYATVEGKPVSLDVRTGKVFGPAPPIAPYLVNADVGIVVADDGGLTAYPVAP